MNAYWITVNDTDLSSWPTGEDARRALQALQCMMKMGGKLVGKLAVEGPRGARQLRAT